MTENESRKLTVIILLILGDPGAVNGGARKINRRDERFHESLQGARKINRRDERFHESLQGHLLVNFRETFRRADLFSSRPH